MRLKVTSCKKCGPKILDRTLDIRHFRYKVQIKCKLCFGSPCIIYTCHAAYLICTCQARGHGFDCRCFSQNIGLLRLIIPGCLIKQPNGTLSRMYVETYIRV